MRFDYESGDVEPASLKQAILRKAIWEFEQKSGELPRYLVGHPSDRELKRVAGQVGLTWVPRSDVSIGYILLSLGLPGA